MYFANYFGMREVELVEIAFESLTLKHGAHCAVEDEYVVLYSFV